MRDCRDKFQAAVVATLENLSVCCFWLTTKFTFLWFCFSLRHRVRNTNIIEQQLTESRTSLCMTPSVTCKSLEKKKKKNATHLWWVWYVFVQLILFIHFAQGCPKCGALTSEGLQVASKEDEKLKKKCNCSLKCFSGGIFFPHNKDVSRNIFF